MDEKLKPVLFYSRLCPYCSNAINIIMNNNTRNNYRLLCVDDPNFKMSEHVKNVPTLFAKELNKPLVGAEVINWIQSNDFFNIPTNNVQYTKSNPIKLFSIDNELQKTAITKDTNLIAWSGNDDEMNKTSAKFNEITQMYITNTDKHIIDSKMNKFLQEQKLNTLEQGRKNQIDDILSKNKKFS